MNLKPRFLLLTGLLILCTALVAGLAYTWVGEGLVERWGRRLAEKQVLYDRARTLQPLLREIALARQLAASRSIQPWARRPNDPLLTRQALEEMENYRRNFRDRNFFIALADSGRYYFNDADNTYAGHEYRYTLTPGNPDDEWFYAIMREKRDFHINVNPDTKLNVVKLWIDVLMRDGEQVLGVVGTGLDLSRFLDEVVDVPQPGITSLFVDHNAAIQLYRDPKLIDYASIVKTSQARKSLDLLLDRQQDVAALRTLMVALARDGSGVSSRFVTVQGKRILAGVAYLPEIDWYEITLMDLDVLLPKRDFIGLVLVFGACLLLALLLFNYAINRLLLGPLSLLEASMARVRTGAPHDLPVDAGKGEIGRLIGHFRVMADAVLVQREELERQVTERTEALDRLAKLDPLTELLNRRGMQAGLDAEASRAQRSGGRYGVIWLDVDRFKDINDRYGHGAGDAVLVGIARLIRANIRPYDSASRWGGDEFLVLLPEADAASLRVISERIRARVAEARVVPGASDADSHLSVSLGACLSQHGEPLDAVLRAADEALYAAKNAGRNRVVMHDGEIAVGEAAT